MEYFYKKAKQVEVLLNGHKFQVQVMVKAFDEQDPFDGDLPEDIAAYNAGEFKMVGITVTATAFEVEGTDHLGMTCYKSDDDIVATVAEHSMEQNAIDELKQHLGDIVAYFGTNKYLTAGDEK